MSPTENGFRPGKAGTLAPETKVLDRLEMIARFGPPREETVVFTNGCFDLLHAGHIRYLYAARALGDRLVVGLNSDASVRRLKGADRPIVDEADRAVVLAALACVDAVTIFEEETPRELIAALLPDVLVKGGDYRPDEIVGAREVHRAGGRVVVLPYHEGYSTSQLERRIREIER